MVVKIKDWEDYEICREGKVYSLKFNKKRLLRFGLSQGYPAVTLYSNGFSKKIPIHRLLAEAFIPNPSNKPHVNHKNGKKMDYRLNNLEWVTPMENIQHAIKAGLRKPMSLYSKKISKGVIKVMGRAVQQLNLMGEVIAEFDCAATAAKKTGIARTSICLSCRNFGKKTIDKKKNIWYRWQYKSPI